MPSCGSCCPAWGGWGSGSLLPALLSPQALRAAGWSVSLLDLAGVDHFDIIEKLSEENYVLTQVGEELPSSPRSLSMAETGSPGGPCEASCSCQPGRVWGCGFRAAITSRGGGAGPVLLTGLGSSSQVILNMISRP